MHVLGILFILYNKNKYAVISDSVCHIISI